MEMNMLFIPNSINIGLNGSFAPWVGALIPDIKQQILLIAEPGKEQEAITRMARVGYDHCIGYLDCNISEWIAAGKEVDKVQSVTADELVQLSESTNIHILDVRKKKRI